MRVGVEVIVPRGHLLRVQQLGHLAPSRAAGLSGHMVDTLHRLGWDDGLRGLRGWAAHLRGREGAGVNSTHEVLPSETLPSLLPAPAPPQAGSNQPQQPQRRGNGVPKLLAVLCGMVVCYPGAQPT